jgi:hypothetical protein
MTTENTEALLAEIFQKPSGEVIENRFEKPADGAPCSGTCAGGACRAATS